MSLDFTETVWMLGYTTELSSYAAFSSAVVGLNLQTTLTLLVGKTDLVSEMLDARFDEERDK